MLYYFQNCYGAFYCYGLSNSLKHLNLRTKCVALSSQVFERFIAGPSARQFSRQRNATVYGIKTDTLLFLTYSTASLMSLTSTVSVQNSESSASMSALQLHGGRMADNWSFAFTVIHRRMAKLCTPKHPNTHLCTMFLAVLSPQAIILLIKIFLLVSTNLK